jgi:hypothetical protein
MLVEACMTICRTSVCNTALLLESPKASVVPSRSVHTVAMACSLVNKGW